MSQPLAARPGSTLARVGAELRARAPLLLEAARRRPAFAVAVALHVAFAAFALEPLLAWILPPPPKPTGLLSIFSGSPPPPPHLEVLAWAAPITWILGFLAIAAFFTRGRQAPAVDDTVVAPPPTRAIGPGARIALEGLLGAGAMGRVHAARDTLLDRPMAVKELAPELTSDADHRARFLREARILARLSHPNVVQLYDLVEEGERLYLCLELVAGPSLKEVLARGPVPVDEAARIGRAIADALAYAHGRGVIHRDLKPANVLLGDGGLVKVVDFGVARLVDQRATRTGLVVGTPLYMAPEQIQGGELDGRADLYALGVLLFELVSGRPPFDGEMGTVLARHLTEPPPPLELPGETGVALASLTTRLLAKDPASRPPAEEVSRALAALRAAS